MSDAETIDPPLQGSSPPPRDCRSDSGRGVAGEAAGGIPRGFHDGIRPSFWYNNRVLAPVSPQGGFPSCLGPAGGSRLVPPRESEPYGSNPGGGSGIMPGDELIGYT